MKQSSFRGALEVALADLSLLSGQLDLLERHWELVTAWNSRVNLTAVLDDVGAAQKHYRDSLEALSVLVGKTNLVDIGSGAGFPGLPLAIALPKSQVSLVEPRRKRVSFLETVVARLGLTNVRVIYGSSTDSPDRHYEAVVTRATFSAAEEIQDCMEWVKPGGVVIAYRSEPSGLPETKVHEYNIGPQRRVLEIWTRFCQTTSL